MYVQNLQDQRCFTDMIFFWRSTFQRNGYVGIKATRDVGRVMWNRQRATSQFCMLRAAFWLHNSPFLG